jgi:2,4-dichlorophenol 6-monooxygenase
MTSVNTTVLIVGGGPAGLLAGMLLDKLGIDFLIVERNQNLHQAPQAHVISSRSLEICRAIGIDDASIRALGPDPMKTRTVRWVDRLLGRDLGVYVMGSDPEEVHRMLTQSPTPTTNLSQDQFEQVLFDQLVEFAGADKVRFGHRWEGFTESPSGYVSKVTAGNDTLEVTSKYLIGADGAGSRVRKACGFDMAGPDNIQTFVTVHFTADLREVLQGREGLLYWVMDEAVSGVFIAHDIDRGEWIFMKTVDETEDLEQLDEEKFAGLLREAIGADVPHQLLSLNSWRMTSQIASGYRKDGVFLVGDAAHRFPPTGGIGMNTGFQDVHNLIWKIGMVEAGMDPAIFDTYEPERKPVAETNAEQSFHNNVKMLDVAVALDVNGDKRITADDLDAVLTDEARQQSVQAAVDAQAAHFNMAGLDLGVCYSGPGVIEDGAPPVPDDPVSTYLPSTTPGSRLPHAPLEREGSPISTLDLLPYDRFLVWTQSAGDDGLDTAVADLVGQGIPVSVQRLSEQAGIRPADDSFAALFPKDEVLVVRPDGHIAARVPADQAAGSVARAIEQLWSGA